MALGLDNIVLKEHLKRQLSQKVEKLRFCERVLTDFNGKAADEAYFVLVDEDIYFSDVKCNSLTHVSSLRHVTEISIIKTPKIGLVEEYRVQTLQISFETGHDADEGDEELEEMSNGESQQMLQSAGQNGNGAEEQNNSSKSAAQNPSDPAEEKPASAGAFGCFGRRRNQQPVDAVDAPQPAPLPEEEVVADNDEEQPSSGVGGCCGRRRKPNASADAAPTAPPTNPSESTPSQPPAQPPTQAKPSLTLTTPPSTTGTTSRSFYIICNVFSARSTAYLHLRNTWQLSVLMKSLLMDKELKAATTPRTGRRRRRKEEAVLSEGQMSQLFRELRADILRSQGNIQEGFGFLFELKLTLDRQYPVKRLFWETDELFRCVVNKLLYYLNKDPQSLEGRVTNPAAIRLDELDYCLLSLQILSAVFLDTEFLIERKKALASQQGYYMQRMIRACAIRIFPCCSTFVYDPSKERPDHRVCALLHAERMALLHHVVTFLRVGGSGRSDKPLPIITRSNGSITNEQQLVQLLELEQTGLHQMLSECVMYLSHALAEPTVQQQEVSPIDDDDGSEEAAAGENRVRPQTAVTLFYMLYCMHSILLHSQTAREFLQKHHREDFRHYVSERQLRMRLPLELPLLPSLLELCAQIRGQLGIVAFSK